MGKSDNFLTPNHRKLELGEITSLLEKFNINDVSKLPKIKIKDSAVATLEVQVGDVVEILRNSFAGETKYYRVVIE